MENFDLRKFLIIYANLQSDYLGVGTLNIVLQNLHSRRTPFHRLFVTSDSVSQAELELCVNFWLFTQIMCSASFIETVICPIEVWITCSQ